jgi:hypothetical protein
MIMKAGTAKRLRRRGGTLYTVPRNRPKPYSCGCGGSVRVEWVQEREAEQAQWQRQG